MDRAREEISLRAKLDGVAAISPVAVSRQLFSRPDLRPQPLSLGGVYHPYADSDYFARGSPIWFSIVGEVNSLSLASVQYRRHSNHFDYYIATWLLNLEIRRRGVED